MAYSILGIFNIEKDPENISLLLVTLLVFQFEISGKNSQDSQPENI